jgi:hypothetical protein
MPRFCRHLGAIAARRGRLAPIAVALTALGLAASVRGAQPAPVLLDEMNAGRPVLQLIDAGADVQLVRQAVEAAEGAGGDTEHVTLAIPPGGSAMLAFPLPEAPVLPELRLEAVAWCNRPGMLLAAIVELPGAIDPVTGKPRQLVLRSETTAEGGMWAPLVLADVPKLLERNARVARAKYGPAVVEAGAYVTHLAVIVPGGRGPTDLWLDRVALFGELRPSGGRAGVVPAGGENSLPTNPVDLASTWSAGASAEVAGGGATSITPRQAPPPLPRIIQWQGEPLALLRSLGFDAVWMGQLPNADELAEATRLGLWLVCPPPSPEMLEAQPLGAEYDGVLAWDLGELASPDDVALAERWARALQRRERLPNRPTVLRPIAMSREASRIADIVVLGRPTVGSTATWAEHAAWLTQARRLARPGVTVWTTVDTQRPASALVQLAALRGGQAASGAVSYQHLAQATAASLGVWPRGYWFLSRSSLAATDAETRLRVLALELANLRLGMIEPWLARGKASAGAKASQADLLSAVLTVERSHLVIPMRWGASGAGAVGAEIAANMNGGGAPLGGRVPPPPVTLLVPGVPESCEAYLLSVAGPRQLATRRVTGGLRVTVDDLPDDGFVLLTEDGYAFAQVERFLRRYAARAAQVRVELVALRAQQAIATARRLSPDLLKSVGADRDLAGVDPALTAVKNALAARDYDAAFARAAVVDRLLDDVEARLLGTLWPDGDRGASPVTGEWATLADLAWVAGLTHASPAVPSSLPAGEFEDLTQLLDAGWRRQENLTPGLEGSVRLSPDNPQRGHFCLELEARLTAERSTAPTLAAPPVWITSPPLVVPAGHVVEIRGWARVTETPVGSADPLLVFDSIGGEESAVRIATGSLWQPFRLVRIVPPGAECRLTIALGGVGRAGVDSLEYRLIPLPMGVARR